MEKLRFEEIIRNDRFIVEFNGLDIKPFSATDITLPKYYDDKFDEIRITLLDFINYNTIDQLLLLTKNKWYKKPILKSIKIKTVDLDDTVIDEWDILVKKIVSIDFGCYSYDDDSNKEMVLSIIPKKITYLKH
jgi:hypothetical protein